MARKILLADDSVTAQNMGRKILADAGYEVITVNNGSAALKRIAEQKPDLIVLDVYMPGYSGLEVCQRLKEAKETARIPVLLTVGKLEPFKPEECKRVRAEGFIVKPFEASELLSALSKLEDRVVPRAESSKPGRFARAIAAVEEGRSDETEANDADNGWKSRIVFPSKKKKKETEYEEEPDTYNPVNRDLKTIIDRPAPREKAPKADDHRLDVAALAAAGLPKDVTAEELAALAAAAAQVQAAVEGREAVASSGVPTGTDATAPETTPLADAKESNIEAKAESKSEGPSEAKIEEKIETKPGSHPELAAPSAQPETDEIAGATFARQTSEPAGPVVAARDFDVVAAPAGLDGAGQQEGSGSETASSTYETENRETENREAAKDETKQDEAEKKHAAEEDAVPATMAASAAFASVSSSHRWTAVPVAIAAEEAALSLEQEMQKAYAAFATAEANQPGFMVSVPGRATPNEEEIARTLRDVAHASNWAVDSALAQLEAVAETQVAAAPDVAAQQEQKAREQAAREQEIREQEARAEEARRQEAREREAREQAAREQEAREQEARAEAARQEEARLEAARQEEARQQEIREREAREQAAREQEIREREARAEEARQQEAREQAAREQEAREREEKEREAKEREAKEQEAKQREIAAAEAVLAEAVSAAALARITHQKEKGKGRGKGKEKVGGGDMAEKENEIAATTAAAWASWRQIRESGDGKSKATGTSKSSQQEDDDEDYPEPAPDKAAMAVAAGAEKSPGADNASEGSTDDPEAIAKIVDKVLADLRPKIAEEISKKLKNK